MRKIAVSVVLLLGLTVGGAASAATTEEAAPTVPVLTPQTFEVQLVPTGEDGSGTAVLTVDLGKGTVCYDITVTGIGLPTEPQPGIGSAHIHYVQGGAIAVDLDTDFKPVAGTEDTYQAIGCVEADRRVLIDILLHPEQYYINVHTADAPGGAVQGSLA